MKNLKEFLDGVVKENRFMPETTPDGKSITTWCNFAADEIAKHMGFDGLHSAAGVPYSANEQHAILKTSRRFVPCGMEEATKQAQSGHLVFASAKLPGHGHICALYPAPPQWSGYFGKNVPMVANVGKDNGIMKLSYAFKVCHNPEFFIYAG